MKSNSKRGNREGSIYKRNDGRWVGQIALDGDSRIKRQRKIVYGRTRADVRRKLVAAQKTLQDGGQLVSDQLTLSAYMLSWLEHRKHEVRWQTWRRYEQLFRTHIQPGLGNIKLVKLQPSHLRDLYAQKLDSGLSATTVKHIHAVLRAAMHQAERDQVIVRNVCRQVDPPRTQQYQISPLSPVQARRLLKEVSGHEDEALYVLAITTGMRQAELLGLRWQDVDLQNGFISVRRSLVFQPGAWSLDETKTKGSQRRIHLTTNGDEVLRSHKAKQLEYQLALGPPYQDHDLVFPTEVGTPRRGANVVYRSFRPLLRSAGLPQIRFHDLRHTAATLLLSQGVHPKVVSEMLGHSSVRLTLDTYSHVTPTMQQQATDAMESILAG
jgi:integrase